MAHSATVYLGNTASSYRHVESHAGDPATFEAGLMVTLKSDGTLSLTETDGERLGVSLGINMSDTANMVPIVKSGTKIPVQVTDTDSYDYVVPGAIVYVDPSSGKANKSDEANVAATNAIFESLPLDAYKEDGTTAAKVAYISMPGGL
jgi:hypothetical protein